MEEKSEISKRDVKKLAKRMFIEMNIIIGIALIIFALDALGGSIGIVGIAALAVVPLAPAFVLYRFYRRLRLLTQR
ncbi:MAG: hypothetical protein F7C32_04005 [Desulfurococcales archaeon]|nr:hypothetical protein [Desulfurococcales archaeon]